MAFSAHAQVAVGIKAGPDFSSIANKTEGSKSTSNGLIGFEGGVYVQIPAAPQWVVQPALLYDRKGGKYTFNTGYVQTWGLNYLTLPIDILYKPEMPNGNGSWYLGAGPYIAYGISGKISDNGPASTSVDPFKDYGGGSQLKRMDAGGHVQVGYETSGGFNIGLNASLGLMNIASHGNTNNTTHNTSFAVTVGYTFPPERK